MLLTRGGTIPDLAERYGLSQFTIHAWLRKGLIAHTRFGRRILVDLDSFEKVLEANYRPAVGDGIFPPAARPRKTARAGRRKAAGAAGARGGDGARRAR